jgi:hypothetical protein
LGERGFLCEWCREPHSVCFPSSGENVKPSGMSTRRNNLWGVISRESWKSDQKIMLEMQFGECLWAIDDEDLGIWMREGWTFWAISWPFVTVVRAFFCVTLPWTNCSSNTMLHNQAIVEKSMIYIYLHCLWKVVISFLDELRSSVLIREGLLILTAISLSTRNDARSSTGCMWAACLAKGRNTSHRRERVEHRWIEVKWIFMSPWNDKPRIASIRADLLCLIPYMLTSQAIGPVHRDVCIHTSQGFKLHLAPKPSINGKLFTNYVEGIVSPCFANWREKLTGSNDQAARSIKCPEVRGWPISPSVSLAESAKYLTVNSDKLI